MDQTARQEVNTINVVPDPEIKGKPWIPMSILRALPEYLDNSHMIEIIIGKACVRSATMLILRCWIQSSVRWGHCHVSGYYGGGQDQGVSS